MNAEIIAVGSELLLGQIDNTNASYLSTRLADIGINVYFHQAVGDNQDRIQEALKNASSRSDAVIITGGLGPTQDDVTREACGAFLGLDVILDNGAEAHVRQYFEQSGREVTEANLKQANTLEGAEVFPNDNGLACGTAVEKDGVYYVLLPGPPKEMKRMADSYALPYLAAKRPEEAVITSRLLRFYAIGESSLAEKLESILSRQSNPTIAPLAQEGEVMLRLTARSSSGEENIRLLDAAAEEILEKAGDYCYGEGEEELDERTAALMRELNLSVSAAESLTGGAFADRMTTFAGASMIFPGGVVCYGNEAKMNAVGVSEETLKNDGAVSRACAVEMAEGAKERFGSDYGISFTGAAGPDPLEGYEPGEMFIGFAGPDFSTAEFVRVGGSRSSIRMQAVKRGLYMLYNELRNRKGG
ncbi:competence/damage-inducible protein A [Alkalicoccus urumqiensis]|uniref:Putative competence-damage inducible protein n=1 Tax=Alkalicoccus urumqiensis TaxID=1548213 RepID=A0A2P6MFZ0_ALKUR|nr:competence/damage-inducible protein A [Alkalicoccus urumqiensis]PRO65171.1 competence/damage-inducible protein A [Alkalicoccus urumqiensis]